MIAKGTPDQRTFPIKIFRRQPMMWVNFLVTLHSDTMEAMARNSDVSPYLDFDRDTWRGLRKSMPQVLTEAEVKKLAGIGENINLEEVADVYLPLSRLI